MAAIVHVFLLAAAVAAAHPVPPATAHAARGADAPADEYFGRLRMSALRIRLRIDQLAARYRERTESDDDLVHDGGDVEQAMHDWIGRYPRDRWAAATAFHVAQFYAEVQSTPARAAARGAFAYAANRFPTTRYGRLARARLAAGFAPLHAEPAVVASSRPAPLASGLPSSLPAPSPASSPATSASPSAAPASPRP